MWGLKGKIGIRNKKKSKLHSPSLYLGLIALTPTYCYIPTQPPLRFAFSYTCTPCTVTVLLLLTRIDHMLCTCWFYEILGQKCPLPQPLWSSSSSPPSSLCPYYSSPHLSTSSMRSLLLYPFPLTLCTELEVFGDVRPIQTKALCHASSPSTSSSGIERSWHSREVDVWHGVVDLWQTHGGGCIIVFIAGGECCRLPPLGPTI